MALISCPECGKQISEKATICIGCGYPIQEYLQSIRESFLEYLHNFSCIYNNEIYDKDDFIKSHKILIDIKLKKIDDTYLINILKSYLEKQNADVYKCIMEKTTLHKRLYNKKDDEYISYVNSGGDIANDYDKYAYFFHKEFSNTEFIDLWSFIKLYYFCGIGCERDLDLAYRIDALLKLYDCDCSSGLAGIYYDNSNAKFLIAMGYAQFMKNEESIEYACECGEYPKCPSTYIYPLYTESEEYYCDMEGLFRQFITEAADGNCVEAIAWQIKELEEERFCFMDNIANSYIENPITGELFLQKGVTQEYIKEQWAIIHDYDKKIIDEYKNLIQSGHTYYAYWLDDWIRLINSQAFEKDVLYDVDIDYKPIVGKYRILDISNQRKFLPNFSIISTF